MNKNDIKKLVYKQKKSAVLSHIKNGIVHYLSTITLESRDEYPILFKIPVDDMGDATFTQIMEANLLLRWLEVLNEEENDTEGK